MATPKPTNSERQFPASRELALAPRKHALSHPWNRGYPNNRRLQELAAKSTPKP